MSFKKRLISVMGAAAIGLSATAHASSPKNNESEPVAETQVSWQQNLWNWTGGAIGKGIDYVGKGISLAGDGISWTLDKATYPVRKIGEGAKYISDKIEDGGDWIEGKTGIPMTTVSDILGTPSSMVYNVADNASDFLTEAPAAAFGVTGSALGVVGNTVAADFSGAGQSAKDLGTRTWALTKTTVADAGVLVLDATSPVVVSLPYDAIGRDVLAASNRIADLAMGQADLSKPVPKDVIGVAKYTYDKAVHGREEADALQGKFSRPIADTQKGPAKDSATQKKTDTLFAAKMASDKGRG